MKVIAKAGKSELATVYIAEFENERKIEFVDSVQPPYKIDEKWVLIVSTLFGCPIKCKFCDAGGNYRGKLTAEQILAQIHYLVTQRFPNNHGKIPVKKFKIQFARMGEPALNPAVLETLELLPELYDAPGLLPALSTVAPIGTEAFFERLLQIKNKYYRGKFQLQFSIHTTDRKLRDWLIPIPKWDFDKLAVYGNRFYTDGDRKITLNFALSDNLPINTELLLQYFSPSKFIIKITPVNPTYRAMVNKIRSADLIQPDSKTTAILNELRTAGYEVIVSVGELEENQIGSNCGQFISNYEQLRLQNKSESIVVADNNNNNSSSYTYPIEKIS